MTVVFSFSSCNILVLCLSKIHLVVLFGCGGGLDGMMVVVWFWQWIQDEVDDSLHWTHPALSFLFFVLVFCFFLGQSSS